MPFDLPPPDPGIEISVATRGMSKGIAQTEGPQMIARSSVKFGDVQFGDLARGRGGFLERDPQVRIAPGERRSRV